MKPYRKAVGAVIIKDDKFLLVKKIRAKDWLIKPRWDFSKGGIEKTDKDLKKALLRELYEETHSRKYKIIKRFRDKMCFVWPKSSQILTGFKGQKTTMFLVEYTGDGKDLKPDNYEISDIEFFSRKDVLKKLTRKETIKFFRKNIK